jgi:hypothetical protein
MPGCQVAPHSTGKIPKAEIDTTRDIQDYNFAVEIIGNAIRCGNLKRLAVGAHINICSINRRHGIPTSNTSPKII